MRRLVFSVACYTALVMLAAQPARAITIPMVTIGNAGNAQDPLGHAGAVGYEFLIGTYEVRNFEYVEFLNAKAASDPLTLYSESMGSSARGGILRSGVDGSFIYTLKAGMANKPVNFVGFYDALRFANWLNNGQGSADTESGAYTMLGNQPIPQEGHKITRNAGATWFLPSENEWYKAAYHKNDGVTANYFQYPTSSDTAPTGQLPPGGENSANTNIAVGDPTDAGAYVNSESPYGTFDQGGNASEWNEKLTDFNPDYLRGRRGGEWNGFVSNLRSTTSYIGYPEEEDISVGFRVAAIATIAFPGDANGDKVVDFDDLGILLNHYDQPGTFANGDFDESGTVDFTDLGILLNNYNQHAPVSTPTAAVPEPSTCLMIIACALGCLSFRRGTWS